MRLKIQVLGARLGLSAHHVEDLRMAGGLLSDCASAWVQAPRWRIRRHGICLRVWGDWSKMENGDETGDNIPTTDPDPKATLQPAGVWARSESALWAKAVSIIPFA